MIHLLGSLVCLDSDTGNYWSFTFLVDLEGQVRIGEPQLHACEVLDYKAVLTLILHILKLALLVLVQHQHLLSQDPSNRLLAVRKLQCLSSSGRLLALKESRLSRLIDDEVLLVILYHLLDLLGHQVQSVVYLDLNVLETRCHAKRKVDVQNVRRDQVYLEDLALKFLMHLGTDTPWFDKRLKILRQLVEVGSRSTALKLEHQLLRIKQIEVIDQLNLSLDHVLVHLKLHVV